MGRHKRYPTKKSLKSKGSDLKNIDLSVSDDLAHLPTPMDKKSRKMNKAPSVSMLEEQPITWRERNLQQMAEQITQQQNMPRKRSRKPKSRLLEETLKLGYHHMPWESARTLVYRIQHEQNKAINDELLKARFGKAGRDIKEIAKEYKDMDERNRMRKERKIAQIEKQSKLRREKGTTVEEDETNIDVKNEKDAVEDDGERTMGRTEERAGKKPARGGTMEEEEDTPPKGKRKRLTKTQKLRHKRGEQKQSAAKELILNAREVIPFGERVDAPPTFRNALARLHERAGQKDLLLKGLLRSF